MCFPYVAADHAERVAGIAEQTMTLAEVSSVSWTSACKAFAECLQHDESAAPGRRLASYHEALFYPPPAKLDVR